MRKGTLVHIVIFHQAVTPHAVAAVGVFPAGADGKKAILIKGGGIVIGTLAAKHQLGSSAMGTVHISEDQQAADTDT